MVDIDVKINNDNITRNKKHLYSLIIKQEKLKIHKSSHKKVFKNSIQVHYCSRLKSKKINKKYLFTTHNYYYYHILAKKKKKKLQNNTSTNLIIIKKQKIANKFF